MNVHKLFPWQQAAGLIDVYMILIKARIKKIKTLKVLCKYVNLRAIYSKNMHCYTPGMEGSPFAWDVQYTACKEFYETYFIIFTVYKSNASPPIASATENRDL